MQLLDSRAVRHSDFVYLSNSLAFCLPAFVIRIVASRNYPHYIVGTAFKRAKPRLWHFVLIQTIKTTFGDESNEVSSSNFEAAPASKRIHTD